MLLFYYIAILLSIIGYGTFINEKVINYKTENIGHLGLIGIFSLILISYISTQFIAHTIKFNLIILILGNFIFFNFFFKKKYTIKNLKILLITTSFMLIAIFLFKNHDDFPYYHFPYIFMLTEHIHPVGLGKLNIGFNTHSSIFLLASLFNLPGSNYTLFHLPAAYYMLFGNIFLLTFIAAEISKNKNLFLIIFAASSFVFINIFFYRLAEHGTDRSAMILIIILILHVLIISNRNFVRDDFNQIKFLMILLTIIISLKALYILYFVFLIPVFLKIYKKKPLINLIKSNSFLLSSILFILVLLTNLFNSGCLLFPEVKTCFENLSWGMPSDKVEEYRIHYENWAKAGAGAGYSNYDKINYIQNLNWIQNWKDKYFFNKVSDFLFSIIFMILILYFLFKQKKNKKKIKTRFKLIYFFTFLLFLIWFFNYPALRYGGYNLFFILFFLPFSIFMQEYIVNVNKLSKKLMIILIASTLIFVGRNVNRLVFENEKYLYNPFKNTNYRIEKSFFRYQNTFDKIKREDPKKITEVYKNRFVIKK